jgi:hypothetical protein
MGSYSSSQGSLWQGWVDSTEINPISYSIEKGALHLV